MDSAQAPDNSFRSGDPRHIDLDSESERGYWCKALGVTESQLRVLVGTVGTSAQAVKDALAAVRRDLDDGISDS